MAKQKQRKNLFVFLKDFFSDVKKEGKKVIWTSKKNLLKYSICSTIYDASSYSLSATYTFGKNPSSF